MTVTAACSTSYARVWMSIGAPAADAERRQHDERGEREQRGDGGLRPHRIAGHPVPVHPCHRRGQRPVEAGHEDEAGEREVVDHGDEQEEAEQQERDELACRGAQREPHRGRERRHLGRPPAGGWDRHHHCPCAQQVGRHHGQRSPQQIAGDRALVLDLHAHVERHLDAQQREHHQTEEAPVAQVQAGGDEGAHADQSAGSVAAGAPLVRCTSPPRTRE